MLRGAPVPKHDDAKPTLYSVGHSTRSAAELIAICRSADVRCLVDIRRIPRSRTNPQFNQDVLPATLKPAGIAYVQLAALGGRRSKQPISDSPNTGWEVKAFQNYADYAASPEFQQGLDELLALAAQKTCAVMCSEAVWWRCHRRIVADYALARGVPVVHLLSETNHQTATLTRFAVVGADGRVTYPPPAGVRA